MQSVVLERVRGERGGTHGGGVNSGWRRARHARRRLLALLAVLSVPQSVLAQASVVAFPTDAEGDKGNAEIDRALRSALDSRSDVKLAPAPALDLEALQLAIECSGINTRCLREVAERTQGEVLIAATLERKSQQVELRILYFSAKDAVTRFAAHKEHARKPGPETLEAIPGMLDELFATSKPAPAPEREATPEELPAPDVVTDPSAEAATGAADGSASEPRDGRPLPAAPLLVAGGGAVLLGAGLVVGLLAKNTEDDYAKQPVTTPEQASVADGLRVRGQNQALIANVLIGVGAAAVAAGGIWLLVAAGANRGAETAVVPDVGPGHAALRISGRWGGL